MIDASKTRKRQLAFELQSSRIFEKRSKFRNGVDSTLCPRNHNGSTAKPFWIYNSRFESVGGCGFQIHLCILARLISREFTCEAITTFLPAQFPWIWCDCLLRNSLKKFNPFKTFFLSGYIEVLVKYSLLLRMQESLFEFDTIYGNDWRIYFSNNQFIHRTLGGTIDLLWL